MNNNIILLVSRILMAIIFILAGVGKFADIAGTAGYIESVGLPAGTLLAWLSGIFELVGGLAILVGFRTGATAWALAIFSVVAALFFHNNLGDQMQMVMFLKNLAMAGGFLALSIAGPGSYSLDARRA
jgi:putative oxidoreductase